MTQHLPSDPEGMNDARARWAEQALLQFITTTATDWTDALGDLLADLMHLADRDAELDFVRALEVARRHYAEETMQDPGG